jgi:hypothetical protein
MMRRITLFNVTFNNISVISWRSYLLVEETIEINASDRGFAFRKWRCI